MKRTLSCCFHDEPSLESLAPPPRISRSADRTQPLLRLGLDTLPPSTSTIDFLQLHELPAMDYISLTTRREFSSPEFSPAFSFTATGTTNSRQSDGQSEAAREIRRIFSGATESGSQSRRGKKCEAQILPTSPGKETSIALLKKRSSKLSKLSKRGSRKSEKLNKIGGTEFNHGTDVGQRRKNKEKAMIERDVREGSYDEDAEVIVPTAPRGSWQPLIIEEEDVQIIDYGLDRGYLEMLRRAQETPIIEAPSEASASPLGEIHRLDAMNEFMTTNGENSSQWPLQRSQSDPLARRVKVKEIYRVTDASHEMYKDRLSLLRKGSLGSMKESPPVSSSKSTRIPSIGEHDSNAEFCLPIPELPRDSGISLRDLDPSEASSTASQSTFTGFVRRASTLITPSRRESVINDPSSADKARNIVHVGTRSYSIACEHGGLEGVDGQHEHTPPTPSRTPLADDCEPSPTSFVTRTIRDIVIPPSRHQSRRSFSEAVASPFASRIKDLAETGRKELGDRAQLARKRSKSHSHEDHNNTRTQFNSFRQRFFSHGSPSLTCTSQQRNKPLTPPPRDEVPVNTCGQGANKVAKHRRIPSRGKKHNFEHRCFSKDSPDSSDSQGSACHTKSKKYPSRITPRQSRFKEIFDDDNQVPGTMPYSEEEESVHTPRTMLPKPRNISNNSSVLYLAPIRELTLPQSFDGNDGDIHFRTPNFGESPVINPADEGSAGWERALRMHRLDVASGYVEPSGFYRGRRSISQARVSIATPRHHLTPVISPGGSGRQSVLSQETRRARPSIFRPAGSGGVISVKSAKSVSSAGTRKQSRVPPTSPVSIPRPEGSWAKFPSHLREQRNGPAGFGDKVVARDFAESLITAVPASKPPTTVYKPLSFKQKFKKDLKDLFIDQSYGHRSSIAEGGEVRFPELEILPKLETHFPVEEDTSSPGSSNRSSNVPAITTRDADGIPAQIMFSRPSFSMRRKSSSVAPDVIVEIAENEEEANFLTTARLHVRRKSSSVAPDVVVEQAQESDDDSRSAYDAHWPMPRFDLHLHPADAMRPRSASSLPGMSHSDSPYGASSLSADDALNPVAIVIEPVE
jgi:hypothetical protein